MVGSWYELPGKNNAVFCLFANSSSLVKDYKPVYYGEADTRLSVPM